MIARFRRHSRWSLLALPLLLALGFVTLTDAQSQRQAASSPPPVTAARGEQSEVSHQTGPDLIGQVNAKTNHPKATVFIYTAGPKVGTSPFCPSCYADCRKSAKTDAQGAFKIEKLDPQLEFRILVVAKGYKPKFVWKVDPAKGPVTVNLEPMEAGEVTPDRSIRGQVLDPEGKPVVGAAVEADGIRKKNDSGTTWGQLPGVDPLAVTDEQGEFVIGARDPFESLDVTVKARAFANKRFTKLASGTDRHKMSLTEGGAVTGRVIWNGQPLSGVSVGVAGCDRTSGNFAGYFDVGADSKGRFYLVNLPPNVDYFIYGKMSALKTYGAIPVRKIHVGEDGSKLDVGDLIVEPAFKLAGQVVCADGQSAPAKTRLVLSREQAWDSIQLELDGEGRFETAGVPKETFTLSARIPGYRLSSRNNSLDSMNPFRLIGRMDRDTTNLIVLLEKGPEQGSHFDSYAPESERPQNRALRGAEGVTDHSSQFIISGQARDSKTQQPLGHFFVTPGSLEGPLSAPSWDQRNRTEGSNGNYLVYLNKRYSQPLLKVEAKGYLPGKFTLLPESRSNFDLTLQTGAGPSGTVLLPDGKPGSGAKVALLCSGEINPQVSLRGNGELESWQHKELIQVAGQDGSFSLPPQLDMVAVAVATEAGFKMVSIQDLAANPKVVLEPWGQVKGLLHRASALGTNEDLDLKFQEEVPLSLQYHTMTDGQGRFDFDHVPPVRLQINGRIPVSWAGWQWDPLKKITLKPGQDLQVEIQAPARAAAKESFQPSHKAALTRKAGPGPSGTVLLPNGKPAVEAEVALMVTNRFVSLGKGALRADQAQEEGWGVRTGPDGHFELSSFEGVTGIVAVHNEGYLYLPLEAFSKLARSPQLTLEPWGQIEGTLQVGGSLATNQQVEVGGGIGGEPMLYSDVFRARTDDHGRFVFTFVPPGERTLSRVIPKGEHAWTYSPLGVVTVKPGVTTQVTLSVMGRAVIGKVSLLQTSERVDWDWYHARASLRSPLPDSFSKLTGSQLQRALMYSRNYPVTMGSGGSFQADEIPPGKYDLDITFLRSAEVRNFSGFIGRFHQEIIVPEAKDKSDRSPVDLGIIEGKLEPMPRPKTNQR